MNPILTIFCSIIGSSAVFSFIQFFIDRRDRKLEKNDERNEVIQELADSVANIYSELATLRGDMEKAEAINARVRILRGADKLRMGQQHSKEYYDQLNEDITNYNNYCNANPGFKNNKALNAIEYIDDKYQMALKKNDFL